MKAEKYLNSLRELVYGEAAICSHDGRLLLGELDRETLAKVQAEIGVFVTANLLKFWQKGLVVNLLMKINEGNFLYLNNAGRIEDEVKYQDILVESLPYIAQVAGGDAVLFDSTGARLSAFYASGESNHSIIGVINPLLVETMRSQRPSMGPTFLRKDCTAVRIPISRKYGISFNNNHTVKRQTRLLEDARRYNYARYNIEDVIGESKAIVEAKALARTAANHKSNVLLTGETGTGKEIFAHAIHNLSSQSASPFVAINCGAIPENLAESILFGYVGGAFTGAKNTGQIGAFEQASSGTLFLDEISEMPLDMQVKLLRAIQEREISRVGDSKSRPVSVRIITSTNKSLPELVEQGRFRADLYYRLNVIGIEIPPLRRRVEDINYLTAYFVNKFMQLMGKKINDIEPTVLVALSNYPWPGNVRELQNCVEYMCTMIEKEEYSISRRHLPPRILGSASTSTECLANENYDEYMGRLEKEFIERITQECNGNKTLMARRIGLNRTTLWRIMNKYNL